MELITFDDFLKVDLRAGTIVAAKVNEHARRPSYVLEIDFGDEIGVKTSSAQITDLYTCEGLIGKQVLGVVNFPKKQIARTMSECLIVGCVEDEKVTLVTPERPVKNGSRLK